MSVPSNHIVVSTLKVQNKEDIDKLLAEIPDFLNACIGWTKVVTDSINVIQTPEGDKISFTVSVKFHFKEGSAPRFLINKCVKRLQTKIAGLPELTVIQQHDLKRIK